MKISGSEATTMYDMIFNSVPWQLAGTAAASITPRHYNRTMHASRSIFLLTALFVFAGVMHFVIPASYAATMPSWIPFKLELVYITGLLEIAGGLGLLVPSLRRFAGAGLILLLIAVFPANVQMLMSAVASGEPVLRTSLLWLRLPLQPLLIVWVFRAAIARPSRQAA